jgi:LPXTG-motif cell wall-anchored protein
MMHRGLVRIAVTAGAAMIAGLMATTPAIATPTTPSTSDTPPAPLFFTPLSLPEGGLLAKDFKANGCDGIPGGAKSDTDGWVFDQPLEGVKNRAYTFELVNPKDEQPVMLWIDNEGIVALDLGKLPTIQGNKAGAHDAKSLLDAVKDAKPTTSAQVAAAPQPSHRSGLEVIPAPVGVAGGLIANGGAWLQTPAGWLLGSGALLHDNFVTSGPPFNLLRVCAPKVLSPSPVATASPSTGGAGGGNGEALPVTGTNVGIIAGAGVLLIGVGAMLFVVRRRRGTRFVA